MPTDAGSPRVGGEFVVWFGIVLAATAALLIVVWMLRRWWRRTSAESAEEQPAWSLQQLRELRSEGQITDAEYARLAARMSASLKEHKT